MTHDTVNVTDVHVPAVTKILAQFVCEHPFQGWPDVVRREAQRTFYNWLGCAIGGAHHEAAHAAAAAVALLHPSEQATLLGRHERSDMASAALINGISSHTFDFDDTHLKTIIHPAAPVAPAVLALAEWRGCSGHDVTDALVIGIDVACRIGNAIYPEHYDCGWHITGSTGVLGAAAACARLMRLNKEQTMMALGIAASQPVGFREQFGTMTKPLHAGAAARAGLMSALLAAKGFTASARALEAPRGYLQVISAAQRWNEVIDDLGQQFEILFNTYKPFACGIVAHPSIDACIRLKSQNIKPEEIVRISLRVHPLVLELTGKTEPRNGLEGKFSVFHGCAVGLLFGHAGEAEFSDQTVLDPTVVALRRKVHATADPTVPEQSVIAEVLLKDGRRIEVLVDHAIGSLHNPLSDIQLQDKFLRLTEPVLGAARAQDVSMCCWDVDALADIRRLTAQCRA